jgi:hypothetical protein
MEHNTAIDADWEETRGVHEIRNLLPCMGIDFYLFVKTMAFHGGAVDFQVLNDPGSNTKLRFTISFTDTMGIRHTITSKYFQQLMLQAAALEREACEQRSKNNIRPYDKQQPGLL